MSEREYTQGEAEACGRAAEDGEYWKETAQKYIQIFQAEHETCERLRRQVLDLQHMLADERKDWQQLCTVLETYKSAATNRLEAILDRIRAERQAREEAEKLLDARQHKGYVTKLAYDAVTQNYEVERTARERVEALHKGIVQALEGQLATERAARFDEKTNLFAGFEEEYKRLDGELRPALKAANAELNTKREQLVAERLAQERIAELDPRGRGVVKTSEEF